jgi:Ca-activated chloride channel family protein
LLSFQHKEFAWLLAGAAVILLLFIYNMQWKRRVRKRMGDEKLVRVLTGNYSRSLFILKFVLLLAGFIFGVIAVMNPRKPGESLVTRKGIDLAIALDVSKSMLAADLSPNRLERAKQFINKLLAGMPDDRVALILFAGQAYLQMPLTVDHGSASLFVNSASPDAIPQQGTLISDALEKSANALNGTDAKFKTVVLITDGEDHEEGAVNMAKKLSTQGVMINTVGIGSTEGSTITDPATGDVKRDESGNPVISKLNENILKEIASATNGAYTRLESSDAAVSLIKEQLSQIDRKAYADNSQVNFKTWYAWFAVAMFLVLVVEIFIGEKSRRVKPVLKSSIA